MDLIELRRQLGEKIKRMKELFDSAETEKRDLTEEEDAEYGRLEKEVDKLKANLERAEKLQKHVDWSNSAPPQEEQRDRGGLEVAADAVIQIRPRYAKLRAFTGPDGERDAYYSGQFLRAVLLPEFDPKGADEARQWCHDKGIETRVQSGGTVGAGGATVPTVMQNRVIDLVEEYGVIRRECGVWPMSSDTEIVPRRTTGLTAYFVGDTDATTASQTAWDNVNLVAREMSALARVPISLAEDSVINFADRIALEIARAFAEKEDDCAVNGDGTSTYGGIIGIRTRMIDGNHAGSYEDATAGDDQWPEYILDDLEGLIGKVPAYPGINEKWYCSKIAWAQTLVRLAAAQGGSTGLELTRGFAKQFLGYDVVLTQKMPTSTSALDAVAVFLFGDISMACTFGSRNQMAIRTSDQRYFEYRQIGILGTQRIAFVVHDIGDATTAGPLVALRGNTS